MLHLVDENAKVHAVQRVYAVISSRENALHRFNDARLESTLATANGRSSSRSPRASLGRLRRPSTSALGEAVPQGSAAGGRPSPGLHAWGVESISCTLYVVTRDFVVLRMCPWARLALTQAC